MSAMEAEADIRPTRRELMADVVKIRRWRIK
jgi:hypothetical protein